MSERQSPAREPFQQQIDLSHHKKREAIETRTHLGRHDEWLLPSRIGAATLAVVVTRVLEQRTFGQSRKRKGSSTRMRVVSSRKHDPRSRLWSLLGGQQTRRRLYWKRGQLHWKTTIAILFESIGLISSQHFSFCGFHRSERCYATY